MSFDRSLIRYVYLAKIYIRNDSRLIKLHEKLAYIWTYGKITVYIADKCKNWLNLILKQASFFLTYRGMHDQKNSLNIDQKQTPEYWSNPNPLNIDKKQTLNIYPIKIPKYIDPKLALNIDHFIYPLSLFIRISVYFFLYATICFRSFI